MMDRSLGVLVSVFSLSFSLFVDHGVSLDDQLGPIALDSHGFCPKQLVEAGWLGKDKSSSGGSLSIELKGCAGR